MGYTLKVSTDDVMQKAGKVKTEAAALEQQVGQLTSDMAALAATWDGAAANKFHDLYDSWKGQARTIQSQLESIGKSLNAAGTNYEHTEAQNVASF